MGPDEGGGAQENRVGDGQEAESRGRGSKGLKEWEAGEIGGGGGAKGRKARKKGARSGDARNGVREVWTPCPPHYFSDLAVLFVCVIFWDKYRNFTYVTLKRFL